MEEESLPSPPDLLKKYWPALLLAGVSLFCIVATIILLFKTTQTSQPIRFSGEPTQASSSSQLIVVDIEGAVEKPGLYELPEGSRIDDLLQKSGGLTSDADSEWVAKTLNRAGLLSDGAKLFIPKKGTASTTNTSASTATDVLGADQQSLISVNTASITELDTLSGVGEVTVKKIIDNRPYLRLEELLEKNILKPSVFEKIKNHITL